MNPVRFVTAAALFDGHDAAINIMRRILQSQGAEVIHLGHDRSVAEIVDAAISEDVQGLAVSSYQGGHVEFFEYLASELQAAGAGHIKIFGGGGGVIIDSEIERLATSGVTIFSPSDGQRLGLPGMINELIKTCDFPLPPGDSLPRTITRLQAGEKIDVTIDREVPVLGITGTGGSGKSSLTDELIRRLRIDQEDKLRIAVLAIDPTRRRGGGALLGDRIRMNSLDPSRVFFRSLATRGSHELPDSVPAIIDACKAAGYDLVILETPGIGQGDAGVAGLVDTSLYVMTPEFGAASQLEKIDMLDFADVVAINKFERRGAADAMRDVARQLIRNREAFASSPEDMPVFGTSAATFNDDGVTALYHHLAGLLKLPPGVLPKVNTKTSTRTREILPAKRVNYLADIAETVRDYHAQTTAQVAAAQRLQRLVMVRFELEAPELAALIDSAEKDFTPENRKLLTDWDQTYESPTRESLSGLQIPRVAIPRYTDHGELLRFLRAENLPGQFPFTAGVFPLKREGEDPARMFAGEGDAARTNQRFKTLSEHARQAAVDRVRFSDPVRS